MTVWAETQGHRVNSFVFTCLSQRSRAVCPGVLANSITPSMPPATQTCSQRQPDLLELGFQIFNAHSSLQQKLKPPQKRLH